jgi:hypothetical protein
LKMDQTEGSETSAIINQTPGNYPKENLLYSVHGESLKSRSFVVPFPYVDLYDILTSIPLGDLCCGDNRRHWLLLLDCVAQFGVRP